MQAVEVTAPPEWFFERVDERARGEARRFYRKFVEVGGLPVVAAEVVDDVALRRAAEMVVGMLAGRADVLAELAGHGMYLIIIGRGQVYTDMPEHRDEPDAAWLNERVRGTGGLPTSFGEENLLSLPVDRYDDESIAVHEFAHTIDFSLRRLDPAWEGRLAQAYALAVERGLFAGTYAGSNMEEYWAEGVQSFFDCNRINNWNHGPIGRREQLASYDPDLYELIRTALRLGPGQDWRYRWLQELPRVTPPPEAFGFPAYYTKFSYARELPVLGRAVDDAHLLAANHLVRRMFAYRHDILKELIRQVGRLVVLAPDEALADLPEGPALMAAGADPLLRRLDFNPSGLMVVCGAALAAGRAAGADHPLVAVLARAIHTLAERPEDPGFHERELQQYELRVKRVDVRLRAALSELFHAARAAGRWHGTSAMHSPLAYWTRGVLCYFDAAGDDGVPPGRRHPVRTREELVDYDPQLAALVAETMAFEGRVDWRLES